MGSFYLMSITLIIHGQNIHISYLASPKQIGGSSAKKSIRKGKQITLSFFFPLLSPQRSALKGPPMPVCFRQPLNRPQRPEKVGKSSKLPTIISTKILKCSSLSFSLDFQSTL